MEEVGAAIDPADKSEVEADISAVKAILEANPNAEDMTESQIGELKAAHEKLTESAQKVFAKMYEQSQAAQQAAGGAGPDMGADAQSAPEDDVVDADFKEV